MWNSHAKRWMTPVDKLAALGFPVTRGCADILQVPPLPVLDPLRADAICGNSMHFANSSVVMLLALPCFGKAS